MNASIEDTLVRATARPQMRDHRRLEPSTRASTSAAVRRTPLRRSMIFSILAALLLIGFVCLVGDVRRRRTATSQMERYARALNAQIGGSRVLPMNLDPADVTDAAHQPIEMDTLSRSDVRCLRDRDRPILIAWTVGLVQVLGANGRVVVIYKEGTAHAMWFRVAKFDALNAIQHAALDDCE